MYEHLIRNVEMSAEERMREIREQAATLAGRIRQEALAQGEMIRQQHLEFAQSAIASERSAIKAAREKNRLELLWIKDEVFQRAFSEAKGRLVSFRDDPVYEGFLRKVIAEVLDEMECESVVFHIDRRDEALVSEILSGMGLHFRVVPDIECIGGVIACSADESVVVKNTLESRLDRLKEVLRSEIFRLLEGS